VPVEIGSLHQALDFIERKFQRAIKMKVAWTRRSLYRLRQILEHIAKDQPDNAEHFVERLIECGDSVGLHPRNGFAVE
jgi:hypothetical protein